MWRLPEGPEERAQHPDSLQCSLDVYQCPCLGPGALTGASARAPLLSSLQTPCVLEAKVGRAAPAVTQTPAHCRGEAATSLQLLQPWKHKDLGPPKGFPFPFFLWPPRIQHSVSSSVITESFETIKGTLKTRLQKKPKFDTGVGYGGASKHLLPPQSTQQPP